MMQPFIIDSGSINLFVGIAGVLLAILTVWLGFSNWKYRRSKDIKQSDDEFEKEQESRITRARKKDIAGINRRFDDPNDGVMAKFTRVFESLGKLKKKNEEIVFNYLDRFKKLDDSVQSVSANMKIGHEKLKNQIIEENRRTSDKVSAQISSLQTEIIKHLNIK